MKHIQFLFTITVVSLLFSCEDYLDIVPDNIATIDNAFSDKTQAEKYLYTCYSYLPYFGHPEANPGFNTGDENWIYWPLSSVFISSEAPYSIARGLQNKVNPYDNFWDGENGITKPMWRAIRECNIFLENIDKVNDLSPYLKQRWVAEATFLKAYYHWYLFRNYGPIPIVDKNLPISASVEDVRIKRQPVDSVVNYIASLIDKIVIDGTTSSLPNKIDNLVSESGRITKPAALMLKARLLVTAASPLFNGNSDFNNLKNKSGEALFNSSYDPTKWEKAVKACEDAINASEEAGNILYEFNSPINNLPNRTKIEMSIRNAVCEKWNKELIWGSTTGQRTYWLQRYCIADLDPNKGGLNLSWSQMAPTLKMAELFYSNNGVPIEEDKTWNYENRFDLRATTPADSTLQYPYQTVGLHFNREPRFYADIAFDGAYWFMQNGNWKFQSKAGQTAGKKTSVLYSTTGYYIKKLVNWNLVFTGSDISIEQYPFPIMRLGDLYLLYSEALNEVDRSSEALIYLNKIRSRAGLQSVETSWANFSTNPTKHQSKEGLRNIIHQERLIEMAFEGSRIWDLKRWKEANNELNKPVYGWDIIKKNFADYNRKVKLFDQKFISPRDYFWPIKESNLTINSNLIQNPGW